MALYSVWDWDRNNYRIFTTPTPVSVGDDPVPPKPTGISPIGANPDTDIKPLPAGAKFIGHDNLARGEIRRMPGGLTDLGDDAGSGGFWTQPAIMFGAGVLATFWGAELYEEYVKKRRVRSNRRKRRRR